MATTFHTIDKDIYGQEDFHKNYKSAQREGLTDQQSQKLSDVLYPQKQSLDHNEQPTKEDLPELVEDIVVDGDVLEIWDKISEEERLDMESGVTHLVSQGINGNLLLGQWSVSPQGDWEKTIGSHGFIDDFTVFSKPGAPLIDRDKKNYQLLLRVDTHNKKTVIKPLILEIPSKKSLLMDGMVFYKELEPADFLHYLSTQKDNLLVGKKLVA